MRVCRLRGDEQLNSLGNQVSYYEDLIRRNLPWTFVPGYIDEGLVRYLHEKARKTSTA